MNYFSETFKIFKKNWFYIFIIDLASILLLVGIFLLLRLYLGSLVSSLQSLGVLSGQIGNEQLASVIDSTGSIVLRYNLAVYFIFPLVLLLVIGVLQAFSFGIAQEKSKRIFNYRYLARFLLFTFPAFIVGMIFASRLIELLSIYLLPDLATSSYDEFLSKTMVFGWMMAATFIMGYFTFIAYGMLLTTSARKTFISILRIGIRKFYFFLPLILVFAVIKLVVIGSLFSILLSAIDGSLAFGSIFLFLTMIALSSYLKTLNALLVKRYQHES